MLAPHVQTDTVRRFSIVFVWYNQPDNRLGVFLMHCYLVVCIYTITSHFLNVHSRNTIISCEHNCG